MPFNFRELYATLVEQERLKGHHTAEGAAIRTLSRCLTGWLAENLTVLDVLVLCEQSMEEWLKARLGLRPWSSRGLPELLAVAVEKGLVSRLDAVRLARLRLERVRLDDSGGGGNRADAAAALELCIGIVQRHW